MKTFFKIVLAFVLLVSCGEADTTIFNGKKTFLSFSSNVYSLPVEIDATGSLDVILNSSTVSDVDRTFPVTIVAEETTADPLTYTLPATVTIPAGSFTGVLKVLGADNGLEESTVLTITFTSTDETSSFDSNKAIINVTQFCPIENGKFEGIYRLEQTSPASDFGKAFVNQNLQIKKIGDASSIRRSFSGIYLEDAGVSGSLDFAFDLLCGSTVLSNIVDTGLTCTAGSPPITVGPGNVAGTYNPNDDAVFFLTITEFVQDGGCGAAPVQTTLKFTKQ